MYYLDSFHCSVCYVARSSHYTADNIPKDLPIYKVTSYLWRLRQRAPLTGWKCGGTLVNRLRVGGLMREGWGQEGSAKAINTRANHTLTK